MKKPTNDNYPLQTRYSTFKKHQENYERDLKEYLDSHEDNTELYFLEVDLYSHKEYLKHLLTKTADYIVKDEDKINQQKINTQKRIIDFIEKKIVEITLAQETTEVRQSNKNLLYDGSDLNLSERYTIAKKVLNIEMVIRKLNIPDLKKYELLSFILNCNKDVARDLMNGRYNSKDRDLGSFFNEFNLIE
jgi:hypothetical protein